jgi:hypothetical protein
MEDWFVKILPSLISGRSKDWGDEGIFISPWEE